MEYEGKLIPKVIHYCWFGGGEKSQLIQKCIKSWKDYCPDWEIIEWNENNFDVGFCEYAYKAYRKRKYAYLSDAARTKIIYEHGGVYLDTDVELIAPIDHLLKYDAWFAYMRSEHMDGKITTEINTGSGFGATRGNTLVKALLDNYKSFDKKRGFDTCNRIDTAVFVREWPSYQYDSLTRQEYANMIIIEDIWRYAIHHCVNSWLPWYKKAKNAVMYAINSIVEHRS